MIKRRSEIPVSHLPQFKGGLGEIFTHHFLDEKESNGMGRLFIKSVIPPGSSIGEHMHEGDFETYYILQGKALICDNGTDCILEPGDCHICPDGSIHSIKNVGEEVLEYIAIILYTKQKDV